MSELEPKFAEEISKYGADHFTACYDCGNCSSVCSLSGEDNSFPRKVIRFGLLGLKDDLESSVDPWLCYYCGECSETCPRNADPAQLMMAARRYLTASYDWTGLSKKFYTSKVWEITAILLLSLIVLLLFIFFHGPMTSHLTAQGGVELNTFASNKIIELGDWIMAGILSFFLLSNIFNMYRRVILKRKDIHIPLKVYFSELYKLIFHFATQGEFYACEKEQPSLKKKLKSGKLNYWIVHFLLMSSYVLLFTMIVGFLQWYQTDKIYEWWYPQRILGYYATFGLVFGIIYFSVLRIRKNNEKSKASHFTDWTFLILLFLTTITGILVHIFRVNGMAMATYYVYVIHLMILFPMLMIEVPFSKWSHLAYRPFAIYFFNLIRKAKISGK